MSDGGRLQIVVMKIFVAILLIINFTTYELTSASVRDVVVARQQYHQLTNGGRSQADADKRWAPTEIRMNEFIHKIRSRFNSQSAASYVRRARVRHTAANQSKGAAAKILQNYLRAKKPNKGPPGRRPVKLYRLRTRFGRIPSAVNVGEI